MSPWRDIASAPKDGTEVLVWDGTEHIIAEWFEGGGGWIAYDSYDELFRNVTPSHWQPLPPPPDDDAMGTPCAGGGA